MNRKSINKEIKYDGIGLHSGIENSIVLQPAEAGHGIKFYKSDSDKGITADLSAVKGTDRRTILGMGESQVETVEHLLSAAYALGITDLKISLDSSELPILDGNAIPYYKDLCDAMVELEVDHPPFKITEPLHIVVEEANAEYHVLPSDELCVQVGIQFNSENLADQFAILSNIEDYGKEIAPAKTFAMISNLKQLLENNMINGGSLQNSLVYKDINYSKSELIQLRNMAGVSDELQDDNELLNPSDSSFKNEAARHKILDLLGDISLLGFPLRCKIIANNPGHTSNIALAKAIKKQYLEWKKLKNKPHYNPDQKPIVDLEGVKALLPHRYPFLLVDKIIEQTETMVVGVKNITFNEQFFQGHFPGNPVFPGVLQMEALAQTGGILALSSVDDGAVWDTYFLKMDNVKFKNMVVPGDTLILKMELLSPIRRGIVHMQGTAYVGNKIVSEGELIAQIVKRPE